MTITLQSLALDRWVKPASGLVDIPSAVDGHIVACASSAGLNFADMVRHARETGGRALRRLTFHQRADELRRSPPISARTRRCCTGWREIPAPINATTPSTSRAESARCRLMPRADAAICPMRSSVSKATWRGFPKAARSWASISCRHCTASPFNFPCWGLLEKFAPAFLAGVPVIAKPATATAYVTEALVHLIHQSGILPAGSLQLICGPLGDLFDHLGG